MCYIDSSKMDILNNKPGKNYYRPVMRHVPAVASP
jgi:hypothetical protein